MVYSGRRWAIYRPERDADSKETKQEGGKMKGWCMNCGDGAYLDAEGRCPTCGEYCCPERLEPDDEQSDRDSVVLWPYGHQLFAGSQAKHRKVTEKP